MKQVKQMWDKISSFVSLASLIALVTVFIQIGGWKANLDAKVLEVEKVEARLCLLEEWSQDQDVMVSRIDTDLQWIKSTLAEIKSRLD